MAKSEEESRAAALRRADAILSAVSGLKKEFEGDPTSSQGMLAAGKIHEVEADHLGAAEWYRRAAAVDPGNYEAMARLALSLLKAQQGEAGLAAAMELVREAGEFTFGSLIMGHALSSYTVLGDALRVNGHDDAAEAAYERAFKLQKADSYSAGRYGTALALRGEIEKAAKVLQAIDKDCSVYSAVASGVKLALNDAFTLPAVKDVLLTRLSVAETNAA